MAKINAFYGLEQTEFTIIKVKTGSGIQIEIFTTLKGSASTKFVQKFDLIEDTDAYITLDKNTTNLALSDVDNDSNLDVLAPTVDRNGNLRLATYRFNLDLNAFEPYNKETETN